MSVPHISHALQFRWWFVTAPDHISANNLSGRPTHTRKKTRETDRQPDDRHDQSTTSLKSSRLYRITYTMLEHFLASRRVEKHRYAVRSCCSFIHMHGQDRCYNAPPVRQSSHVCGQCFVLEAICALVHCTCRFGTADVRTSSLASRKKAQPHLDYQ